MTIVFFPCICQLHNLDKPRCGFLPELSNGTIQYSYFTIEEKVVANYTCNTGFFIDRNTRRICLDNETWTGDVPLCRKF